MSRECMLEKGAFINIIAGVSREGPATMDLTGVFQTCTNNNWLPPLWFNVWGRFEMRSRKNRGRKHVARRAQHLHEINIENNTLSDLIGSLWTRCEVENQSGPQTASKKLIRSCLHAYGLCCAPETNEWQHQSNNSAGYSNGPTPGRPLKIYARNRPPPASDVLPHIPCRNYCFNPPLVTGGKIWMRSDQNRLRWELVAYIYPVNWIRNACSLEFRGPFMPLTTRDSLFSGLMAASQTIRGWWCELFAMTRGTMSSRSSNRD